jgi:hypothetical protein
MKRIAEPNITRIFVTWSINESQIADWKAVLKQ